MSAKKNRRILTILIVLLVIGLLPGWVLVWQLSKPSAKESIRNGGNAALQANESASANNSVICDKRRKSYENSFLDIGFCYSASWGEVLVQEGKFEPTDTGSRWRLSFTTKAQITLGLVSHDWSSTIPRSPVCLDPATQTIPALTPLTTAWKTEGDPVVSATRGIEAREGEYRIEEYVADLTTNGVCLSGFSLVGGMFRHAAATYYSEFSPIIVSPEHHIANPNMLIPATDRTEFAAFVKSIQKL